MRKLNTLILMVMITFLLGAFFSVSRATEIEISADPHCGTNVHLPNIMSNFLLAESEPNNTFVDADGPLNSGQIYQGFPNDEKDDFFFDVAIDGPITVSLAEHVGYDVQLQLFFESADNVVGFDLEAPYRIEHEGQPGRYYILIYTGSGFDDTIPYSLEVNYPTPIPLVTYFSDDFCDSTVNSEKWGANHGNPFDFFTVADGLLSSPPTEITSCENNWCQEDLRAKEEGNFSEIEIKAAVTSGSQGLLGMNTSCTADSSSIIFEMRSDGIFEGRYHEDGTLISLGWEYSFSLGREYRVRLVQDGSVVRTYIDGEEMPAPYPCPAMGDWLNLGVGSPPGGYVESHVDYIRLRQEP